VSEPGIYKITCNGIEATSIEDYLNQLEDKYHRLTAERDLYRKALEFALMATGGAYEDSVRITVTKALAAGTKIRKGK